jgi:hypothetical protein
MDALEAAKSPSNFTEMRFDYLSLVEEFSKSGGSFGSSALGRILDLAKMMLRDSDPVGSERVASFLGSFAHNILVRNADNLQLKQILSFLNELGPIFKAYAGAADFSKMLEVILCLVENPTYASQPAFSLVVVTHFCTAGLEVFERLASDGFAFSIPFRTVLVRLLCRATLLTGTDIVSIIEQRPITFEFVAGILYPMALNLPSVAEIVRDPHWMEAWRRTAIRRAWICILQQAMQACQRQGATSTGDRAEKSSQPERRRSQEKKRSVVKNYPAATLSMALQTLKIVVLRAEDELSVSLPNIWIQIGLLLKNVLSAGSARFAIAEQGASVPSSPLQPSISSKLRTSEDSDMLTPSSPRAPRLGFILLRFHWVVNHPWLTIYSGQRLNSFAAIGHPSCYKCDYFYERRQLPSTTSSVLNRFRQLEASVFHTRPCSPKRPESRGNGRKHHPPKPRPSSPRSSHTTGPSF